MNIIFLCSSLEPGRDGVGDYTRQLASELVRKGHKIGIIALNDKWLNTEWKGVQNADSVEISVLRLPSVWPTNQRFGRAKQLIDVINPQWLSLQYVPFGFQSKGLPFRLSRYLKQLGLNRKWHIMFHELWVGMNIEASIKLKIWGGLQRILLINMLNVLRPSLINTQTQVYQSYLKKLGFNAEYLPLISNIQPSDKIKTENIDLDNSDSGCPNNILNFLSFGVIHSNSLIEQFAQEVYQLSVSKGIKATLTFVGKQSVEQTYWAGIWQSKGLSAYFLGELPVEQVSYVLNKSFYGLSSTAYGVIEKSGSVMAMLAHGIPVLCLAAPWSPRGIPLIKPLSGVIIYQPDHLEENIVAARNNTFAVPTVSEIASKLLRSFSSSKNHQ